MFTMDKLAKIRQIAGYALTIRDPSQRVPAVCKRFGINSGTARNALRFANVSTYRQGDDHKEGV